MTAYRYPNEILLLTGTLLLVIAVIVLTSTATFCLSGVFILLFFGMAYMSVRSHHAALMQHGYRVTHQNVPQLASIIDEAATRLQVEPVEVYVIGSKALNAYTFGITSPKVIVMTDSLLKVLDPDELQFVIGHEMGHVKLGHTWLNSIIGGLAGIPSPYLAFQPIPGLCRSTSGLPLVEPRLRIFRRPRGDAVEWRSPQSDHGPDQNRDGGPRPHGRGTRPGVCPVGYGG